LVGKALILYTQTMPPLFDSLIILALLILAARFVKRSSMTLQKFFIPSSLIAGFAGLILGPQLLGTLPAEVTDYWQQLPKYLITVVFAGLFLGKMIPSTKEIWRQGAPMIAFGNTLAWGQYVVGIGLTMLILTPLFGANPLAGGLIELGFEGGHGSASGLAPTYAQFGWPQGADIALALATLSLLVSIVTGIILINWHHRRSGYLSTAEDWRHQRRQLIRNGYSLTALSRRANSQPLAIGTNLIAFAVAIGLGWLILQGLILAENFLVGDLTDLRFFTYLPLFPLAMIGGLLVQLFLRRIKRQTLVQRRTAEIFSAIALDVLIASAVATISLQAIQENLAIFIVLGVAGIVWILGCLLVLGPRMFPVHWFENGITNTGQSMGMTATGLLMNRLADPSNKTHAREGFSYKQLVFEPFMGGGIITAGAAIVIYELGSWFALITATVATVFWLVLGLWLGRHHHYHRVQD